MKVQRDTVISYELLKANYFLANFNFALSANEYLRRNSLWRNPWISQKKSMQHTKEIHLLINRFPEVLQFVRQERNLTIKFTLKNEL